MMSNGEDLKAAIDKALKKVRVKRKAIKIANDEFNEAYAEFIRLVELEKGME